MYHRNFLIEYYVKERISGSQTAVDICYASNMPNHSPLFIEGDLK